jgi:hypothetical protein
LESTVGQAEVVFAVAEVELANGLQALGNFQWIGIL